MGVILARMGDLCIPELFRSQFVEGFYLKSEAERQPLRIGVLADSVHLGAPFAVVLDQIRRSNFAGIELVILNALEEDRKPPQPASLPVKLFRTLADSRLRNLFAYSLYTRVDE